MIMSQSLLSLGDIRVGHTQKAQMDNNNVYLYNPNNEKYIMIGTYFFSTDSIVFNEKYKKYILNR